MGNTRKEVYLLMKIALVYWNFAFHCFVLLCFQCSDKIFIYLMYLLMPKNVGTDIKINFLCQILGKLLSFYRNSKWRRPYWWPFWISSCAEKQVSFFSNHVCEKLHHNAWRFYMETTYETKKNVCMPLQCLVVLLRLLSWWPSWIPYAH